MPTEIEARFLNVGVKSLIARLHALNAEGADEDLLTETILYDKALEWQSSGRRRRQFAHSAKLGSIASFASFASTAT